MTVPISGISSIAGLSSLGGISAGARVGAAGQVAGAQAATGASGATSGGDFASALAHGLDAVQASQTNADSLAVQAATGRLSDPAQLTIATTQAQLMTQLATTLESKAVAAFNQIMGLQA